MTRSPSRATSWAGACRAAPRSEPRLPWPINYRPGRDVKSEPEGCEQDFAWPCYGAARPFVKESEPTVAIRGATVAQPSTTRTLDVMRTTSYKTDDARPLDLSAAALLCVGCAGLVSSLPTKVDPVNSFGHRTGRPISDARHSSHPSCRTCGSALSLEHLRSYLLFSLSQKNRQ